MIINNDNNHFDVAIIGSGPAGLAAAIKLKQLGLNKIVVLERNAVAGGTPRHCGHPPFGMIEFGRILNGPSYAKRIVEAATNAGVNIALNTSVSALNPGGNLTLITPDGPQELNAKRVLLATGTFESPRAARLSSGNRCMGICSTGALQSMVYLKNQIPFKRPLVVGTEVVAFSALLTCKKAGIRPVAMAEENARASVLWPIQYTSLFMGVPLYLKTQIINIMGENRVEAVELRHGNGDKREVQCDGVLFTGKFVPEASLARMGHLTLNPSTGSPRVDKKGKCSDPSYYVAGNVNYSPVKMAGQCWLNGKGAAKHIFNDLCANT